MTSKPHPPVESPPHTVAPGDGATLQVTAAAVASSAPTGQWAGAPPSRIGDFTILRVLGEGGMGTVYLAEDIQLGRKAAIKTMKPELAARPENRERFLREAKAAAAVEHDNIVPIWQVGQAADGSPFIAMPFLQGESLDQRLRREPVPNLGMVLEVAREVADGLAAAHAKGLIHRDIKPANVWLEGDPESRDPARQVRRSKILDFGLARSQASEDVHLTASGAVLGTPAYMAPEQADGARVDHRADLFSLGVMLYRMATGKLPFDGPSMMTVLIAVATVTPPSPRSLNRNLPQPFSDLIERMMSKDPAGRPQSAAEVGAAVRQIEKDWQAATSAPTTSRSPSSPVLPGSNPAKRLVLAALALLLLVPVGGWLATIILRVETPNGTLIVEMNDDEVEARIKGGKLILSGPDGKTRYALSANDRKKTLDAGPYTVRVEGADGLALDTPEFTLKKGGEVTVRVSMANPKGVAKAPAAVAKETRGEEPDRKAADYVLSIGGSVRVDETDRDIKAPADLPRGAFRLSLVDLSDNKRASDAGLASFKDCKSLTDLNLSGTRVSDAGLAAFSLCKNLTELDLNNTQAGDAGVAHFAGCDKLLYLGLLNTKVSDSGLACFKECKSLTHLVVGGCSKVSDGGLVPFKGCTTLTMVNLGGTKVTDAGLATFTGCKDLSVLWLWGTQVGDAGLATFSGCKNLTDLNLRDTKVSDEGLAIFKDCKKLAELDLGDTQVTDAGLVHFKGCKNLTDLDLSETKVTDAGLVHFKDCKNLADLDLSETEITEAGLAHFKRCKKLKKLDLSETKVGNEGVALLKEWKSLKQLNLDETNVTRAKVEELKKALPGCKIEWDDPGKQ